MKVKIKKLCKSAKTPTKGSEYACGYDAYACIKDGNTVTIAPHETVKIGLGICLQPEEGYYVGIYARSGLSSKEGLRPANCVGICDEDYRGEYMVALHNDSDTPRIVQDGERIAQLVVHKRYDMEFEEVDALDDTDRGKGGFGSTGKN